MLLHQLKNWITNQFQRKLVALVSAIAIWFYVSYSITDSKTIPNVPIRVIHLPENKTIAGIQNNGIIDKRIPLTLSGSKEIINALEPGDIEILLDASQVEQNDWIVQIAKKNLISLNPSIDLNRHISEVSHPEFVIKFSNLMSAQIPVRVHAPTGTAPSGYDYLDIWPQKLIHLVVGPEEIVQKLLHEGLDLQIDMDLISKTDLDKLSLSTDNFHDDEASFFIPNHWKKVILPFKGGITEEINDPEAQNLHIDFLRKRYFSLAGNVVIRPFYPLQSAATVNPTSYPLLTDDVVQKEQGVAFLNIPLFIRDVSPIFLQTIDKNLEVVVLVEKSKENKSLHWSAQVALPHLLEDIYVQTVLSKSAKTAKNQETPHTKTREAHLRARFRQYLKKIGLFTAPEQKLMLDVRLLPDGVSVVQIQ